jgi:CheY-like chemotaxis protein
MSAIALTAFASGAARRRALEAGYRFHLAKPIDQGELLAAVAEAGKRRPAAGTEDSR